jgi:hypothetical protein
MIQRMLAALCGVATVLVIAAPARAATVQLLPFTQNVSPGDAITLDLVVSGLGGSVVGDIDLDVTFEAAFLTLNTVTPGPALGDILDFSGGLLSPGVFNIAFISTLSTAALDALQSDPVTLASLLFTVAALAPGDSTAVGIGTVNALGDGGGVAIPVTSTVDAELVNAAAVPEPHTWLLLGTAALAWTARWRSHARAPVRRPAP